MSMWIAAAIVMIIVGFILDRAFRHFNPKAYKIFSNVAWTIEGIFTAVALIGSLCQFFTGSFHR